LLWPEAMVEMPARKNPKYLIFTRLDNVRTGRQTGTGSQK